LIKTHAAIGVADDILVEIIGGAMDGVTDY